MKPLEAMEIFRRVAELSSFTAAAESLGLPKSRVSTSVRQLEAFVGTRLLHRTTRRVRLTPDGERLYETTLDLLDQVETVQQMFREHRGELRGRLRVDAPLGVTGRVILPNLPAFLERHPGLSVELSSTDRRVDVVSEGFDCVLRVGDIVDSSLVARPLGAYRIVNVASRAYIDAYGMPTSLEDLERHRLIHYVPDLGNRSSGFEYVLPGEAGRVRFLPMAGSVTVSNSDSYRKACLAGLGIIQVPEPPVRAQLDAGDLVEVLPEYRCAPMPVTLLYANRRHLPQRVRVFMDWLAELMAPILEAPGGGR
ncbi:LysR family transcriptional regulator [Marinimicrobium sp. ARAG 43.8]|uniref:LysR family transcriptional regulator n=1 Tax=Marinimicrobium sp. ARAG 43.8 TaxID=3418719 RepID=UPI003CED4791